MKHSPLIPLSIKATLFSLLLASAALAQETDPKGELFDDDGLPRILVAPSVQKRDRIAIAPLKCVAASLCDNVQKQLARNLEISTFFEIIDSKTFVANMDQESLTETNWPDWFNVGARYLIKGEISGSGPYRLELRLYNVVEKQVVKVKGQSHRTVPAKGVHAAVDEFINGVIGALTGKPGIFGTHIVYAVKTGSGTRGIGLMEMDGHGRRGVAGGDTINMLPHFAPGGAVLYTSFRSGKPDLWVGKKRLTNDSYHYRGASYSKSGQLAASLSMGDGSNIFILSAGGKIERRLTRGGQNVSPTWSPDGGQVAFVSDRAGGPQVYVVSAGGGSARRVTMAGGYNSTPHWGNNGVIVFGAMTGTGADIFTVDPETSDMVRITQDQGTNTDPCWSPDGRYIAFVSVRKGHGKRIWLASPDGRWQFPISSKSGGFSTPRWGN